MRRVLCFLIVISSQLLNAQNYFSENERYYQLTNDLELLLIKDQNRDGFNVSYSSKAGSFTETEELDGITGFYTDLFFVKNVENPSTEINQELFHKGIKQESKINEEYLNFTFEFYNKSELGIVLNFLTNQLNDTTILQSAIDFVASKKSRGFRLNRHEELLWGDYYNRMNTLLNPDSINERLKEKLMNVQKYNLCTQNSLLVIDGDIDFKETLELVQNTISGVEKCDFNYFSQYPIPQPKPLRFNQQILSYEKTNFRAEYKFQGPTMRFDMKSLLAASLLNPIVDEEYKNQGISINLKTLYYANPLSLSVKSNNVDDFKLKWDVVKREFLKPDSKLSFLSEEKLEITKTKLKEVYKVIQSNPKLRLHMVSLMWASKDINMVKELVDEIDKINVSDIQNLVDKYIRNANYVLNLVVPEPGELSDSLETETGNSFNDYELFFKRNTGEFIDESQDSIFDNLLYFLKLNEKKKVKIVGLASSNELITVKDKDTYKFVSDEFEHFRIHPQGLRPTSSKIRLDIYRTIKIAQKLNEKGIDVKRLYGSGRLEKEDDEEYYKVYFREVE